MSFLQEIFKSLSTRIRAKPTPPAHSENQEAPLAATAEVDGFTVSFEEKKGTLLWFKPVEGKEDEAPKPASEDFYYEVSIQPNGKNHEYPEETKPSTFVFTIGKREGSMGYANGAFYISAGQKYTAFRVVEEFDDGRPPSSGKRMPPHHAVVLRAEFKDKDGQKQDMAIGGWVRQSDLKRPEWKAALSCPITYV